MQCDETIYCGSQLNLVSGVLPIKPLYFMVKLYTNASCMRYLSMVQLSPSSIWIKMLWATLCSRDFNRNIYSDNPLIYWGWTVLLQEPPFRWIINIPALISGWTWSHGNMSKKRWFIQIIRTMFIPHIQCNISSCHHIPVCMDAGFSAFSRSIHFFFLCSIRYKVEPFPWKPIE